MHSFRWLEDPLRMPKTLPLRGLGHVELYSLGGVNLVLDHEDEGFQVITVYAVAGRLADVVA